MTTEETEPKANLSEAQQRRVLALNAARDVVAAKNVWTGSNVPPKFGTGDLTYLAEWILEAGDELPEPDRAMLNDAERLGYENGVTMSAHLAEHGADAEKIRSLLHTEPVAVPLVSVGLPTYPEDALPNWRPEDSDADTTVLPTVPAPAPDDEDVTDDKR